MAASSSRSRKNDDDDEYVDSRTSGKQSTGRPSYESARAEVEKRQNFVRTASGRHYQFNSIDGSTIHTLDHLGRESIPQKNDKKGRPRANLKRKPALDHMIQYIALKQGHDEIVTAERAKPPQGLSRRNSVDLADAFRRAVADPDNLRLVMHDEHAAQGGHKTRDSLTRSEISAAKGLLNQHLLPTPSATSQSVFDQNLPKWHTPRAVQNSSPLRSSARQSGAPTVFEELGPSTKRVKTASTAPTAPLPAPAPFVFTPGPGLTFTIGVNKGRAKRR